MDSSSLGHHGNGHRLVVQLAFSGKVEGTDFTIGVEARKRCALANDIRYMAPELGDYTGLYWGIPGNLEDVPDEYNFADYGKHEFPYYCNGGIFPQDTVPAIMAFSSVGMKEKADTIKREIFRRQHQGILPNGSGFYMGVVNEPGKCYSILKWDGTPTDYEGIISRDCAFLQSAILTEDPAKALFDKARNRGNQNGGQ